VPQFPLEIVQDGNYVVLLAETEHSVRIILLDGSPHRKNSGGHTEEALGVVSFWPFS
jgi:hypothetical protein